MYCSQTSYALLSYNLQVVDAPIEITMALTTGSHLTCTVDHGDGANPTQYNYTLTEPLNYAYNQTWDTAGEFTITLQCSNFGGSHMCKRTVYVSVGMKMILEQCRM